MAPFTDESLYGSQTVEPRRLRARVPGRPVAIRARLYLSGYDQISVGLLFWDLGVMVGSYLWLRSGYIPRALAAFGILASTWCAVCALGLYIVPDFPKRVSVTWYDAPVALFEIALSFVLLFRGLRPSRIAEQEPLGGLGA